HDDSGIRKLLPNGDQGLDAADVGKAQIHQNHIGPGFPVEPDGFPAARRLRRECHILLAVNDTADSLPHQRMVVHTHDTDFYRPAYGWVAHFFSSEVATTLIPHCLSSFAPAERPLPRAKS